MVFTNNILNKLKKKSVVRGPSLLDLHASPTPSKPKNDSSSEDPLHRGQSEVKDHQSSYLVSDGSPTKYHARKIETFLTPMKDSEEGDALKL